jgi:SAM-dependent methyltransferase
MPSSKVARCRICGADAPSKTYRVREMLHGTRESFTYFECAACGCVQIDNIPSDLGRFYPDNYFAFRPYDSLARNPVRRWIDPRRVKHSFGGGSILGAVAEAVSWPLDYVQWVRRAGLDWNARVLDVGCGAGKTLLCMALGGFQGCEGVDPFIAKTLRYGVGVTVHKATLEAFAAAGGKSFDLIMFHHSFEHVIDPLADLRTAASLLAPDGCILIEIPVADGWAWEHYKENWCNLDPPRHLHLLTDKSMAILAKDAGLKVADAVSVSHASQFTGSERYLRDIPADDKIKDRALFTRAQLAGYRARTKALNLEGRGDQTMFYLRRADSPR